MMSLIADRNEGIRGGEHDKAHLYIMKDGQTDRRTDGQMDKKEDDKERMKANEEGKGKS